MLKHIGRHNDKKVVVLYRQVPNEDHMCLLVYSDLLPRLVHDEVMKSLESAPGQQADNFAEALFRTSMADGRNALEVVHKEGFMKKVPTSQVIMSPTANAKIRLDELNDLLAEMAKGEDAIKRMAELDKAAGLQTKKPKDSGRDAGEPAKPKMPDVPPLQAGLTDALSDEAIAASQLAQATRMRTEAKSLLAEAERLEGEAKKIAPAAVKATKPAAKVVSKSASPVTESVKRGPGRPPKAKNDSTKQKTT